MTEFTIHIGAAPGSGVDVDALGRAQQAANEHTGQEVRGAALSAAGDDVDAAIIATFQIDAGDLETAAARAASWFQSILAIAGVPADVQRVDHLEVVRELEHAVA